MEYLHRRNVLGYVAFNTLIFLRRVGRGCRILAAIVSPPGPMR